MFLELSHPDPIKTKFIAMKLEYLPVVARHGCIEYAIPMRSLLMLGGLALFDA
jgi:hypothetical protein